jgi:hypothetical protein
MGSRFDHGYIPFLGPIGNQLPRGDNTADLVAALQQNLGALNEQRFASHDEATELIRRRLLPRR